MAHKLYRNTDNFKRGTYSYANKMNGREEGVRGKGKSWGGGGEERGGREGGKRGGGRDGERWTDRFLFVEKLFEVGGEVESQFLNVLINHHHKRGKTSCKWLFRASTVLTQAPGNPP